MPPKSLEVGSQAGLGLASKAPSLSLQGQLAQAGADAGEAGGLGLDQPGAGFLAGKASALLWKHPSLWAGERRGAVWPCPRPSLNFCHVPPPPSLPYLLEGGF